MSAASLLSHARPCIVSNAAASRKTAVSRRPGRSLQRVQAALEGGAFQEALNYAATAPPEVLLAGGAAALLVLGGAAYAAVQSGQQAELADGAAEAEEVPPPLPRENAVLVFGATGRMGRTVVSSLLAQGRTVVAAARSSERAAEVFGKAGLVEGRQPEGSGILFIESGVDITNPDTLTAELFAGVNQVVTAVGAVFGRTAEGAMGYLDDMTPERVDAGGVANVAAAAAKYLPRGQRSVEDVLSMCSADDLAKWQRLDDVIMGGQSSSGLAPAEDGSGAVWTGELIVEGGGFCGARTLATAMDTLDLSAYDGICLRVKSDGQTFKLNIKTDAQAEVPEDTFQATFDTDPNGDWTTVYIPWHQFVPVKRARSVPGGEPLDPSAIRQFGLVLSRFEFNGYANPCYHPGPFQFQLDGGIRAYRDPRPQLLMVSSAGVERNAKIGDNEEARKKDIPIVQLNPGAVLNHKYTGENAVRAAGLPYCVLRPTGLTNESEPGDFLLEASQGDRITGRISRDELAGLVVAALGTPAAAGKTADLRRQEAADAVGKKMGDLDNLRLFLSLAEDRHRQRIGLEPFPAPAPPPAPVTEERKKEILSDVRVIKSVQAGRGGRVRDEAESAQAKSITVTSDGREKAAAAAAEAAEGVPANVAEARAWIAAWKAKQGGSGSSGAAAAAEVPANVAEAREWIRRWRAGQLEKQLPADVASK